MNIEFYKYHGAGNDFILIDNRNNTLKLSNEQIHFLCDRRFGIGADGLMLLNASKEFDFDMKYYNSDGYEGSMCGNGGRCIVAFAKYLGIEKKHYIFNAIDGLHEAFFEDDLVKLKMNKVNSVAQIDNEWFLNTGSPHVVQFVENIEKTEVSTLGKILRFDARFGEAGTNVNFIEANLENIKIRTFERGVEAETYACGTGSVASAIAAHQKTPEINAYIIQALGGTLYVNFEFKDGIYQNIWLKGPAKQVYKGVINF
ncbi:MAG: diaminopimelate epimerase [Bacteroidales bacterium]|nr:diaminopimelate epimerase [Bacteroidales bacterium]